MLMRLSDGRVQHIVTQEGTCEFKLECAFLFFLQHFRRMYIGDHAITSSKVYTRLNELIGFESHSVVLNVFLAKIQTNFKVWKDCADIVYRTLQLLLDLASGYSSSKLMTKLEVTSQMLIHHTREYVPFLESASGNGGGKYRAMYYGILGKLLFTEELFSRFDDFMLPFEQTASFMLMQPSVEAIRQHQVLVVGFLRDITGLVSSIGQRKAFATFFEWFSPQYSPILGRIAEAFYDVHSVVKPLLVLTGELVWNKFGRLQFEASSPNGVLLFKEASTVLVSYGTRALSLPIKQDAYTERYRGLVLSLDALSKSLSGDYVNFGVISLYHDPCLPDALTVGVKLAVSVPLQDLLAYPKVTKAYFTFIDVMCSNHANVLYSLDTPTLCSIFVALEAGLSSIEASIVSSCCTSLDHLLTLYLAAKKKAERAQAMAAAAQAPAGSTATAAPQPSAALRNALAQMPQLDAHMTAVGAELLPRLMSGIFRGLLSHDGSNQYSLARPLLPLILIIPRSFEEYKQSMVAMQPQVAQREKLAQAFSKLTLELENDLDSRNRNKFSQNLSQFLHDVKSL
eukprot:TRINITY_DN6052_c0_g1_i4.p1 TRINITY_DN6052_c0_g1~~TRINITY_DN6052_c0_g1_i4.p1  ORF type:complete len:568 (-),score=152.70 TRINITY_DN6052_c0_g1_i4:34-1737(-)